MERPRVDKLLEDAIRKPLIKVVAGAGYGKTEAVYSFLKKSGAVVVWVQLSDRDNKGARFWESFVHSGFPFLLSESLLANLLELGFPETEGDFGRYLSLIENGIDKKLKYVKVFDDFHLIRDQSVARFVEKSITERLRGAPTILISRKEPAINTMALLSKGCVAELGEEQLRFSKNEIAQYFHAQDMTLSSRALADIYDLTEGWAFAISLIGLSMKKDPARGGRGGRSYEGYTKGYALPAMKRNIFKLIEAEIFSTIPQTLQKFLIKLSLVDHLALDFMKSLAPDEKAIEKITGAGSFIRYDSYMNACHVHQLFLDYLAEKQNMLTDDEKREVYVKAIQWCVRNDYKMDAVSYCEKIGDYEKMLDVISTLSQMVSSNAALFLLEVFNNIPKDIYDKYGSLYVMYHRLLLCAGKIDEARAEIRSAVEKFKALPESPSNCRVLFGAYNSLGFSYCLKYMYEHNTDFLRYFEKSFRYYHKSGFAVEGPVTDMCIGAYVCRAGSADKGSIERFHEAVVKSAPYVSVTINGCMYGMADLLAAETAYCRADVKSCEKFARLALTKAREKRQHETENRALYYLLRVALASGDYPAAQEILTQLERQLDDAGYVNRYSLYDIVTGWYYVTIKQPAQVAQWLKSSFDKSDINHIIHGFENIVKLKYHLLERKYHALLALAEGEAGAFGLKSFLYGKIGIRIYESICLYHLKEKDEAMKALADAYETAAPNSLDMFFIEEGNEMRALAAAAIKYAQKNKRYPVPPEWLYKIQTKSATYAKHLAHFISEYRKANNMGSQVLLTGREKEILTGLSRGLSRAEIAASRGLSLNTVKTALQMIYTKLGASDRQEALQRAAFLKLLE